MEYYLAINNNKIMKLACQWMELEERIPSEVTQTQKDEYQVVFCHFICGLWQAFFWQTTSSQIMSCRFIISYECPASS